MPTDAQIEASRANGALSEGPRTPEGRAKSSLNALKHGLTAQTVVLPTEDPIEFEELVLALEEEFDPQNLAHGILVRDLATAAWRLQRACRWSTHQIALFCAVIRRNPRLYDVADPNDPDQVLGAALDRDSHRSQLESIGRLEMRLRRAFYQALDRLEKAKSSRAKSRPIRIDSPQAISDPPVTE